MSTTILNRVARTLRSTAAAAVIGAAALSGIAGTAIATAGAANAAPGIEIATAQYGDPNAAAQYWQKQAHEDTCGIMSAADILGQITGRRYNEEYMVDMAETVPSSRWTHGRGYVDDGAGGPEVGKHFGMFAEDVQKLLAKLAPAGTSIWLLDNNTQSRGGHATGIDAIERYLSAGNKVMVQVNGPTVGSWPATERGDYAAANHFVVVTGIDRARGLAWINDPFPADGRGKAVYLTTFQTAWATQGNIMIVVVPN